MADNKLYYGDNLDILKRHIGDKSVDLVYLDPPFKSDQDYNVLFKERDGSQSTAQIKAFKDTWMWDEEAADAHPLGTGTYPRLQLVTVKDLLEGKQLQLPEARLDVAFKKAARAKPKHRALGETERP
jgi:adenine specific DNA methylase Mod